MYTIFNYIQAIYQFCEYYLAHEDLFKEEDVFAWYDSIYGIMTEEGRRVADKLIVQNPRYQSTRNLVFKMNTSDAENWDLFNADRMYTGEIHLRGEKIPDGRYHLVVHAWVMDQDGTFLISQRQKGRSYSLKWERTGGSVLAGESSLDVAVREAYEELGIDVSSAQHLFVKSEKREHYHDVVDAWLFIIDRQKAHIVVDDEEVANYAWVSYKALKKMKAHNLLVKTSQYIDEVYRVYKKAICDISVETTMDPVRECVFHNHPL